jgi:hypothetical protein
MAMDRRGRDRDGTGGGGASDTRSGAVGKRTRTAALATQLRARGPVARDPDAVAERAAEGVRGAAQPLPHEDEIQRAFGAHDVGGIDAHVGGAAADAAHAIGARAYATGSSVAFAEAPDLHTAAHEAAHVVQQRAGVHLKGGVGAEGDPYEQHADRVADLVVAGRSAEAELDRVPGAGGGASSAVQRIGNAPGTTTEQMHEDMYGDSSLAHAVPGPAYDDSVSYLSGSKFWWSKYKGTQPTIAILQEWLAFFNFHEPIPLDYDHDDLCQWNGDRSKFTANVASIFVADARGAADLRYDWAAVKSQVDATLAPMRAARAQLEKDINTGKKPGPGQDPKTPGAANAADQDDSTQTTIQWSFVPTTVHKKIGSSDPSDKDPPQEQVTGQFTQQFHKDGHMGGELFAGGQVTLSADRSTQQVAVQNVAVTAGGQWVVPLFHDFIELQAVAQVLLGATLQPGVLVNGAMTASRVIGSAQAAGGVNAVFNIPGTDKKLQVVVQAQGAVTKGDGPATADKTAGIGVQFVF